MWSGVWAPASETTLAPGRRKSETTETACPSRPPGLPRRSSTSDLAPSLVSLRTADVVAVAVPRENASMRTTPMWPTSRA